MLTPYDEFPVHQAPHPFSYIPSTDYNWDDGYWFGVFSPDDKVFLGTYMRVNPNSDMIGGCALINVAGRQFTVRFSRCWRRNFRRICRRRKKPRRGRRGGTCASSCRGAGR